MNHQAIERLIHQWENGFFIVPLVILFFFFCLIVGLLYHYKQQERIYFTFYFFAGIILFAGDEIFQMITNTSDKKGWIFLESANTFFELAEFIAFYYFFKKCLERKIFKKISKVFLIILFILSFTFFSEMIHPAFKTRVLVWQSLAINVIEFIFLSVLCLEYFYELFAKFPEKGLVQRPSFLIVTSTFFYAIFPIPFFLLSIDITSGEKIYDILFDCHYLLLMLVLFSISKAFLCKTPITT